jgi:hypothetical protein
MTRANGECLVGCQVFQFACIDGNTISLTAHGCTLQPATHIACCDTIQLQV